MKKILFVCLGNICRSPAAEGTMINLLNKSNRAHEFLVDSAGTSAYHAGERPDERMVSAAQKRKIHLPSLSRPLKSDDFLNFDYIICMDKSNMSNAKKLLPDQNSLKKLSIMTDYFLNKDYQKQFFEIPDPYYGGEEDFNLVLDLVEDACRGFLEKIKND